MMDDAISAFPEKKLTSSYITNRVLQAIEEPMPLESDLVWAMIFSRSTVVSCKPNISYSPVYKSFKFSDDSEGMKKAKTDDKSSLEDLCVSNLKSQDCELVPDPHRLEKQNGNTTPIATEDIGDGKDLIGEHICAKNGSEDSKTRKSRCAKRDPMDYELPELVVFLQESSYHFVKDICIDKKMHSHGKCLVENCELDHKIISCILESDVESKRESRVPNVVTLPSIPKESKSTADEENNNSNINKENGSKHRGSAANSVKEGLDFDSKDEISADKSTKEIVPESLLLVGEVQKAVLTSSMVPLTIEKNDDSNQLSTTISIPKDVERRKKSFDNDLSMATTSGIEELSLCRESQQRDPDSGKFHANPEDGLPPRSIAESTSQIHQDCSDESTLFASCHFSGLISHHGSATPSFRSTSHRSNSSTTSSRSFAFPVLASEWHCSPERMVKPDKRQLKKRESKCARFLCCKF